MRVLLTGATGFLGRRIIKQIGQSKNISLSIAVRSSGAVPDLSSYVVGDISANTDWNLAVARQDVVIHAAARAHIFKDEMGDPLAGFRRVNVDATLNLAKHAAQAGVNRFIFISSIGVNGNANTYPFTPDDQPNPAEPYAQSKWEAEQGLCRIRQETGMEVVTIRPPLVYGSDAPGNFGSLVRWIEKGVPLPLGTIHNKRSLVGIDNLVDLIIRCIDHPAAANQVFLAGDGYDLSTTELLRGVGEAMGKPARLIPIPAGMLQLGAILLGKKAMSQRLLGSLQVDISKTCELLDWKPPYTVEEGLRRCFERSN
ncbi:SDR family oxidoreductase [Pseudomonas stutzeri]|uniref:UDP-glucose 4-epimerase family protein n=1 Tax=Stutzerimonas stutzeri TaxID=316 RepID=UPI002108CD74|nr:SDR family oxidoreductase [Stutzerimonas stutzeri]MCQ4313542.1 SDR family oxidoreductase [Stutzerimonas stutzeri]